MPFQAHRRQMPALKSSIEGMTIVGDFWDFIKNASVTSTRNLPLVHTTDMHFFKKIQENDGLEPTPCAVYTGEKLLYFFYGRPSYRINHDVKNTTAKHFAPICLIMNDQISPSVKRIMPFDSGAFHRGLTHPPMHKNVDKEIYELAVNMDAPRKLIKVFYGDEKSYYDKRPLANVLSDTETWDHLSVDAYFQLISRRSNTMTDDRISAIEVQVTDPVTLINSAEAVILPATYLDRPGVREQIERKWKAIAIPYELGQEFIPLELVGHFWHKVRDFLISKSYL